MTGDVTKNAHFTVWLVQFLKKGGYEVVAITSSLPYAVDAMNAHYRRTTGFDPIHENRKCSKRHGHDAYLIEIIQYKHTLTYKDINETEIFGMETYAIVECEVDDPYFFKRY